MLSPLILTLMIVIKVITKDGAIFKQKRTGKNGKYFIMYKFRTMIPGAENKRKSYIHLNEADGPVFKIRNDPRYTTIGKFLARTGIDELPQLINVIKGEMSLVGPRPLPISESKQLSPKDRQRLLVKPGIVSEWVVLGTHKLKFSQWMKLDEEYIKQATLKKDLVIIYNSAVLVIKLIIMKLKSMTIVTQEPL